MVKGQAWSRGGLAIAPLVAHRDLLTGNVAGWFRTCCSNGCTYRCGGSVGLSPTSQLSLGLAIPGECTCRIDKLSAHPIHKNRLWQAMACGQCYETQSGAQVYHTGFAMRKPVGHGCRLLPHSTP